MNAANKTDIGRIRLVNEDRSVVQMDLNGFVLAIVADGMGGHQAGDIASQMAIEVIQTAAMLEKDMSIDMCKAALQDAIVLANQTIYEFAQSKEQYHGMGTTVVAILANEQFLAIGHIGDSRAYLITTDTNDSIDGGSFFGNRAVKKWSNYCRRSDSSSAKKCTNSRIRNGCTVEVDVGHYEWQQNDIVLMCSDGLSGQLDSHELFTILHMEQDLNWKADQLVKEALEAGGDDNISVILLGNEPILRGDHS